MHLYTTESRNCLNMTVTLQLGGLHLTANTPEVAVSLYQGPLSIKFDHGSTSWLSCLFDCCSVAYGCRDRCGRSNLPQKLHLCVVSGLLELLRSFPQALLPASALTSFFLACIGYTKPSSISVSIVLAI